MCEPRISGTGRTSGDFHMVFNMSFELFELAQIRSSSVGTCPKKKYWFFGQVKLRMEGL